jgi:hypothetical protein
MKVPVKAMHVLWIFERDLIILLQISQVFELTGQIIMKRPYFYKKLFKKMIDSCSRINCSYDTNSF